MKTLKSLVFFVFLVFNPVMAWSVVPDLKPCVRDLETNFFEYNILIKAFALYQLPQGVWSPVSQRLQQLSNGIPDRMKKETANMVPNPIEYPVNNLATAKLLKNILFQIFLQALRENQVNERPTADFMFDYIFSQQMPNWINCFGEEVKQLQSQ